MVEEDRRRSQKKEMTGMGMKRSDIKESPPPLLER